MKLIWGQCPISWFLNCARCANKSSCVCASLAAVARYRGRYIREGDVCVHIVQWQGTLRRMHSDPDQPIWPHICETRCQNHWLPPNEVGVQNSSRWWKNNIGEQRPLENSKRTHLSKMGIFFKYFSNPKRQMILFQFYPHHTPLR